MLRTIRIILAISSLILITLLFLDFTGTLHAWFGWLAKIQLLPAVLALNVGLVVGLILLTLLFGRIYCSVICPLGIFQDVIAWLGRRKKKLPYHYSPPVSWLRNGVMTLFILAIVGGFTKAVTLLAPYSSYGRMVSGLLAPIYQWGNNGLAYLAERGGSYTFYPVDVWMKSTVTFTIAAITFIVLSMLAWRGGRTYCNTLCPVGTVLGFISRFSLFRPLIDATRCNSCGLCARHCKAACIDSKEHKIDYSRCVACMDCLGKCNKKAIRYSCRFPVKADKPVHNVSQEQINDARRTFLSSTLLLAASSALKAQEKKVDGGLATIEDKKIPARSTPLTPPGSLSARNFATHCTACQLCVSVCPTGVLRPSGNLTTLMQPEMSYERGYCRPECTKCSEVCPTGAILQLDIANKSSVQVGRAEWIKKNCIVVSDGQQCDNCAHHCPTGCIGMVPLDDAHPNGLKIPAISIERCIGCGTCENLCPARPFSAIYVEGNEVHRLL